MSQESTAETNRRMTTDEPGRSPLTVAGRELRWGTYSLAATALLFVVHGLGMVYRALLANRYELGVSDLGGVTAAELSRTNPAVQSYIDHLAVNVGGLLVVVGVAMMALVWFGVRRGQQWALATTALLPVVFVVFSIPIHQTVAFDFHALIHLGPAGVGAPLLIVGVALSYWGLEAVADEESGDTR